MPHLLACLRSDREARTQASDSCHVVLFLCSPFKFADGALVSFVRHGTPACHTAYYKMRPVQQCDISPQSVAHTSLLRRKEQLKKEE